MQKGTRYTLNAFARARPRMEYALHPGQFVKPPPNFQRLQAPNENSGRGICPPAAGYLMKLFLGATILFFLSGNICIAAKSSFVVSEFGKPDASIEYMSKSDRKENRAVKKATTFNPYVVNPNDTIQQALKTMSTNSIGCLPVLHHNHLCGILTKDDLLKFFSADNDSSQEVVKDWMTKRVISTKLSSKFMDIVEIMRHYNLSCMPVLDTKKEIIGLITKGDLLDVFEEQMNKRQPQSKFDFFHSQIAFFLKNGTPESSE